MNLDSLVTVSWIGNAKTWMAKQVNQLFAFTTYIYLYCSLYSYKYTYMCVCLCLCISFLRALHLTDRLRSQYVDWFFLYSAQYTSDSHIQWCKYYVFLDFIQSVPSSHVATSFTVINQLSETSGHRPLWVRNLDTPLGMKKDLPVFKNKCLRNLLRISYWVYKNQCLCMDPVQKSCHYEVSKDVRVWPHFMAQQNPHARHCCRWVQVVTAMQHQKVDGHDNLGTPKSHC